MFEAIGYPPGVSPIRLDRCSMVNPTIDAVIAALSRTSDKQNRRRLIHNLAALCYWDTRRKGHARTDRERTPEGSSRTTGEAKL